MKDGMSITELTMLAEEVTSFLPGTWRIEEGGYCRVEMKQDAGLILALSDPYPHNKLNVSGVLPKKGMYDCRPFNKNWPSIGVGYGRTPMAIAADIERRLIPSWEEYLNDVNVRFASQIAFNNRQEDTIYALVQVSGGMLERNPYGGDKDAMTFRINKGRYGSVTVHGDSVSIELGSLNAEDAIEIISKIKEVLRAES